MKDEGVIVTKDFGQDMESVVGKLTIAPTATAQSTWELVKKYPHKFVFAIGYKVIKEKNGVIQEAELLELSIVPRDNHESSTNKP